MADDDAPSGDDDEPFGEHLAHLVRQFGGADELADKLATTEYPTDEPAFQQGMQQGIAVGVLVGRALAVLDAEPAPMVRAAADALRRSWIFLCMKNVELGQHIQEQEKLIERGDRILDEAIKGMQTALHPPVEPPSDE